MQGETYLVTLLLDGASFEWLQALRTLHFPPSRNQVPAHLTLLHTVSLEQVNRLTQAWNRLDQFAAPTICFTGVKSLGSGTAISVRSPTLHLLRTSVMQTMMGPFSRQDQQPFAAHVTVQNKVQTSAAKALFDHMSAGFVPRQGMGQGLMIWRYLGGPWAPAEVLKLRQGMQQPHPRI